RFRPAVLPRVAQIWGYGRDAIGAGIFQRSYKKKKLTQFVVNALIRVGIKRLNNIDVPVPHVHERPDLMLSILETTFLERIKRDAQGRDNFFSEIALGTKGKNAHRDTNLRCKGTTDRCIKS